MTIFLITFIVISAIIIFFMVTSIHPYGCAQLWSSLGSTSKISLVTKVAKKETKEFGVKKETPNKLKSFPVLGGY
jgi:uncharacterized membrane protein